MIEKLVGSRAAEVVLLFLANYGQGYAKRIADTFQVPIYSIQNQLEKFEAAGVLVSRREGKTKIFTWNPRFALRNELQALLRRSLELLPESETLKFFRQRRRPRRTGKPL